MKKQKRLILKHYWYIYIYRKWSKDAYEVFLKDAKSNDASISGVQYMQAYALDTSEKVKVSYIVIDKHLRSL